MKIVFFGSDDFALTHLNALLDSPHQVVGCVTQPDARQGRGMKLVLSPIKALAQERGIPYFQPETLKDSQAVARLADFGADLFVVVAYGRLLTQEVLDVPRLFCINVHGSLLPHYRGAAPIQRAMLNGDTQTGLTIQKMALALDAGDIISQRVIPIPASLNAAQLRTEMAKEGAVLLCETLSLIERGEYKLVPQDETQVSYAPKITKDMGRIDWNRPAQKIYDQIRALFPWPGTYFLYQGKMVKLLRAQPKSGNGPCPGTIMSIDKEAFEVACAQGVLRVIEVHPQDSKAMAASSFLLGQRIKAGAKLD